MYRAMAKVKFSGIVVHRYAMQIILCDAEEAVMRMRGAGSLHLHTTDRVRTKCDWDNILNRSWLAFAVLWEGPASSKNICKSSVIWFGRRLYAEEHNSTFDKNKIYTCRSVEYIQ